MAKGRPSVEAASLSVLPRSARGRPAKAGVRWQPSPHHWRVSTPSAFSRAAVLAAAPSGRPTTQVLEIHSEPQPGWNRTRG